MLSFRKGNIFCWFSLDRKTNVWPYALPRVDDGRIPSRIMTAGKRFMRLLFIVLYSYLIKCLLCRMAGEFIVFRCKYMYYFCFFNLIGLFFSLFSRQRCKSSSRNRFPNPLRNRRGHVSYRMQKC